MNEDSAFGSKKRKDISDEQIDSLLRSFFQLEVPKNLNQPPRRSVFPTPGNVSLTELPEHRTERLPPRTVRTIAVATSVAAMAFAVMMVISVNDSISMNDGTNANGSANTQVTTPGEKPMLVSPQGDSRTSTNSITPDGVTLEEADNIKLHR